MATLIDTSALFALLSESDSHHREATAALPALARTGDLVTHNYVVVETTALVGGRLGRTALRALHERLLPPIPVTWVDESTHAAAISALLVSKGPSFVDLISFELMRREQIDRAFAFDNDFADRGFEVVP